PAWGGGPPAWGGGPPGRAGGPPAWSGGPPGEGGRPRPAPRRVRGSPRRREPRRRKGAKALSDTRSAPSGLRGSLSSPRMTRDAAGRYPPDDGALASARVSLPLPPHLRVPPRHHRVPGRGP